MNLKTTPSSSQRKHFYKGEQTDKTLCIYHGGVCRRNPTEKAFLLATALAAIQNSQTINNENISMKKT